MYGTRISRRASRTAMPTIYLITIPPYLHLAYYSYDGINGWRNILAISSYLVTDPQESRAMISRSHTQAVGRQDTAGVINSTINLNEQFGFLILPPNTVPNGLGQSKQAILITNKFWLKSYQHHEN